MLEMERRWEELPTDCVAHIFERLGLEDKSLGVPFVCKSWYEASLNPLCWRVLDFRPLDFGLGSPFIHRFEQEYRLTTFSFAGFMRFALNRSRGSAVTLHFPDKSFEAVNFDGLHPPEYPSPYLRFTLKDLSYLSDECPALKVFGWRSPVGEVRKHIAKHIHKWKELEELLMNITPSCFTDIITEISRHCKNFKGLSASSYITESDAKAIVMFLPKIKYLDLSHSFTSKEILPIILDGCKELEEFYVKNCMAFDIDEEILRKASHLRVFEYDGSGICVERFNRLFVHARRQIAMLLSDHLSDDSSDED